MSEELKQDELDTVCSEVVMGENIDDIVIRMRGVMESERGIGLAANQIGETVRVIIIDIPGGFQSVVINPILSKASDRTFKSTEGCLSFPGDRVVKIRHKQVSISGFDQCWNPLKVKLRGLNAACAQHEVDHLNGITIHGE